MYGAGSDDVDRDAVLAHFGSGGTAIGFDGMFASGVADIRCMSVGGVCADINDISIENASIVVLNLKLLHKYLYTLEGFSYSNNNYMYNIA